MKRKSSKNNKISTLAEISAQLGICKNTLYKWHKAGRIKYEVVGKKILLPAETIERYGIRLEEGDKHEL